MSEKYKKSLYDLTPPELESFFLSIGEKKFRAQQVLQHLYNHPVDSIEAMKTLPAQVRETLARIVRLEPLTLRTTVESSDGTVKHAYETSGGSSGGILLESVWMPSEQTDLPSGSGKISDKSAPSRFTICVSSQLGCAAGCAFCATGKLGLRGQLTTGEIVYQVVHAMKLYGTLPDTVLFMGMGEPMHNFDAVVSAVKLLTHPNGLAMSERRIVVSTAGELERLGTFRQKYPKIRLAISLNAATDNMRSTIMPVNERFGLKNIAAFARTLDLKGGERLTLEYVLLGGINDTVTQERELVRFLRPLESMVKVNLIPYNEVGGLDYRSPEKVRILAIQESLKQIGIKTFVRRNRGRGVSAACGQLSGKL